MKPRICFFAGLIAVITFESSAALELSGVFITSREALFTLVDPESNTTSGWLALGGRFSDYTLESFDRESETLILKSGDATLALRLRSAVIKDSGVAFSGTISIGAGKSLEVSKVTLVYDAENVFPLGADLRLRLTATKRPDGNIVYKSRFERMVDGKIELLSAPTVTTFAGQRFNVRMDDLGFELAP